MNENLRDVYLEAYTYPETMEIICRRTAMELQAAFSAYLPEYTESDFYETDLGTGGMMPGFMARRCDQYFTLEKKIRLIPEMSLRVFRVPEGEAEQIQAYAAALDVRSAAKQVMDALFGIAVRAVRTGRKMKFDFRGGKGNEKEADWVSDRVSAGTALYDNPCVCSYQSRRYQVSVGRLR